MSRNERNEKRSMRDRVRAKANRPRESRYDLFRLPEGFEKFTIDGKAIQNGKYRLIKKRIDILPYIVGEGNKNAEKGEMYYESTYYVHKIRIDDEQTVSFVCPNKMRGLPCPACEHCAKLKQTANVSKEEIKEWEVKERQLFNVRDLSNPDQPLIWDISYHLFGKLLDTVIAGLDDDDDYDCFPELEGGKTLKISFDERKYGQATFHEAQAINFSDREEDYDESVLEETACLEDLLILRPYNELSDMLFNSTSNSAKSNDEDEDEDEKPVRKVARKPAKKTVEEDEEDAEEEVEDEEPVRKARKTSKPAKPVIEDDDEEDEIPMSKKADENTKKAKAKAQEEDGDDAEETEEEEEKPVRKTCKTSKPAKKAVEEDNDEDEDEDEEGEGEPVKPAKKARKPLKEEEPENEPDEEDEDEDEKPAKKSSKNDGGKCPFGHKFGEDCDAEHCKRDCKTCDVWDECMDKYEELEG